MASSIEFGILREGSTISLLPDFRVDMVEDEFLSLQPTLELIRQRTGIKLDLYSSAQFSGTALDVFIEEFSRIKQPENDTGNTLIGKLLRSAKRAKEINKPLEYCGL